ncbi:hypothetical protein KUM42_09625 [Modestobacter sp. L9-4]|uniref:FtsX-like permease family protein n=1 Tax=Modestobacter sp. L9-4 TaxID=2851567 RepID=UPI001C7569E5|nr:FtsX-like permease family protein [Modestobacter sp. L9-4]QXG77725.1 hypothetical protein KUM42_09625 [Modestobacter sp. L9-4]
MTRAVLPRSRRPGVPLAGLARRTRADRLLLLLTVAVLALTSALAVVTPRLVDRNADAAVQDAVRDAGPLADTTLTAPFAQLRTFPPELPEDSVPETVATTERIEAALPPELSRVLGAPVAAVVGRSMPLDRPIDPALGPLGVRLAWVWNGVEPAVTWVEGAAPGPPAPRPEGAPEIEFDGPPPYPVPIGLSEEGAATLGASVGDLIGVTSSAHYEVVLNVTGVFRAGDPGDRAWQRAPELLRPRTSGTGRTAQTTVAGLLSAGSLPALRLAVPSGDLTRTVTFSTDPDAVDAASADVLPPVVGGLQVAPAKLQVYPTPTVTSRLGLVLTQAGDRVRTAQAQAAVLLAGVVAGAALVLLLCAQLLAGRRRTVLATERARGASLTALAVDLGIESAVLTTVGGTVGVLVGAVLVPGPTAIGWLVPVLGAGLLAGPVCGVLVAARATGGRRVPADRRQRRRLARAGQLRRGAVEVVVVLLAVAAIATLRLRGVVASAADPIADLLLVAAPTLGVAAGAVVLLRLVPLLLQGVLRTATRSRRAVPLLAAVQARSTAGARLPLLALTLTTGLVAVVATLGLTVRAGQETGSWAAVGGDVAVTVGADQELPAGGLPGLAAQLLTRPGVEQAVPARVQRDTQLLVRTTSRTVTVLAVDPAAFDRLLRSTPLPDAPDLALLAGGGAEGVPVLVGPDVPLESRSASVLWNGQQVPADPVGRSPALGVAGPATVVVDAAALEAAGGGSAPPDTLWVVGPGAAAAVAGTPALAGADVVSRQDRLAARRADPLTGGLTLVAAGSAGALLVLAAAVVGLGAAAGAPARGRSLATLRTLGLTGRQARAISLGELLPPVVVAALAGSALGTAVAGLVRAPLALRLLTGQFGPPALVVPWAVPLVAVPLVLVVLAVVAVESSARRRERLGEVLRVG